MQALKPCHRIDGAYHFEPEQLIKDKKRQQILESMDLHFLRFSEQEVRDNVGAVPSAIEHYIIAYEEKHPAKRVMSR